MSPLEQLIMKKMQEGKKMSPLEQHAKMSNLDSLKDEMQSMMKGHLDGSDDGMDGAKVEVASDSPEGLKAGLDKAQDVLGGDEDESDDEHEDGDDAEDEHEDGEHGMPPASGLIAGQMQHEDSEGDLSPEEIDQLQMLLAKLKAKHS